MTQALDSYSSASDTPPYNISLPSCKQTGRADSHLQHTCSTKLTIIARRTNNIHSEPQQWSIIYLHKEIICVFSTAHKHIRRQFHYCMRFLLQLPHPLQLDYVIFEARYTYTYKSTDHRWWCMLAWAWVVLWFSFLHSFDWLGCYEHVFFHAYTLHPQI